MEHICKEFPGVKELDDVTFELKAGTLYPLLHLLEQKHYLESYNGQSTAGKPRKYYRITKKGNAQLQIRQKEWATYHTAINQVLAGGEVVGI